MSQLVQPAINTATRLCAVFGSPIKHSASPAMHNAAFAALGLDWRYVACEVDPKNLRAAIAGAQAMGFSGLNLTVPHKLLAVDMVDKLDSSAKKWGAVNTIHFTERGSMGYNTDADAIVTSLREDLQMELRGATVVVLGAGGAGRTAALKLASENVAELFLVNRTLSKAEEIAGEIRRQFPSVQVSTAYPARGAGFRTDSRNRERRGGDGWSPRSQLWPTDPGDQPSPPRFLDPPCVDLVLNATSLGLKPGDASPLDESRFALKQARAVYDMIYRPAETPLLRAARAAGCKAANGLGMLLHQGAKAFEIWTGRTAPLDVMRRALEENVYGDARLTEDQRTANKT